MKRREFIKNTSIGIAAASVPFVLKGTPPAKSIRLGVIGTGDRGAGLIPFMNSIDGLDVVACCDVLPFRLENAINKTKGRAKGYDDFRRILDDSSIDSVLIATPFSTHAQIAIDAIDAGKHIYCEKTLAKGHEALKDLASNVKSSNKVFQTGHQYHSSRLYSHVVQMIKDGKIGKITAFECQWNRNGDWRRPVPSPELERQINWRMYREFSGGLTAELCSHQIDFVNWVTESTPDKVMGMGGIDYWKDGRETYDNVHLIYHYPSGVKATFMCLTSNAKDDYQIKVMGDKGTIILDYTKAWFYPEGKKDKVIGDVDGVSGATVKWTEGKGYAIDVDHEDPSKQALIDFRDAIQNHTQPISNFETGANTATCVQMALDAMYNNEIVEWKWS